VSDSMFAIHRQEPLPLSHNVKLGYHTYVGPSEEANTGVYRYIWEKATTQVRMIPHLHLKH